MHTRIQYYLLYTIVLFCFFPGWSYAAEVSLSPSTGSYAAGQSFTVAVRVNPQGKSVNAVESTLTFDTSKVSVVSVSKTGSVFSLWTTEPTFSNTAGTIQFGGGSPSPFSVPSALVSITFRAVAEGSATIDFKSASVLAADGLGTDVWSNSVKGIYTITAATTVTPSPTPDTTPTPTPTDTGTIKKPADGGDNAAITYGDPPVAPEIGSKIFLDPDIWYATSTGLFTWTLPFDVNVLALDVSTTTGVEPTTLHKPPISEFLLTPATLADGVQYLNVRYKNLVGWGAITHRMVKVDTTAPLPFTINVRAGNTPNTFPLLVFEAHDPTSGIDKYELTIADHEPVTVTPDEARLGYLLSNLVDGTYTVKVIAFDKAGNKTESKTPLLITAGWRPKVETDKKSPLLALFTFTNTLITSLLLLIIAFIVYLIYERKQFSRKETRLRKETKEIQDQMEKIFSALRDEIHDQIKSITRKPRFSKNERLAVDNLENAIEVSETLIEKEIADVQKILK